MALLRPALLATTGLFVFPAAFARTDIVSQLHDNSAITEPIAPSSLNAELTSLVGTVSNLTTFPGNVQRAMLWSAGWVRSNPRSSTSASGSAASDQYMQVYVQCGRTMSDVFQTASAFDDDTECPLISCKTNVITYTNSTCDPSYVEDKALCALTSASLELKSGPMWSRDGQIDENFDPQLFQYNGSTSDDTSVFMLTQKSSWTMADSTCPNAAEFIAPCREVAAADVDDSTQERTWCEPEIELGVKLWVDEAYLEMTGSGDGSGSSSTEVSLTVAIILGVLLAIFVVASMVLCIMLRRAKSWPKDGLHENEHNTFFAFRGGPGGAQLDNMEARPSGRYISNNGPVMTMENVAQIEAINESFRQKSPELASFCDDQELMLKRISFAGIIYRKQVHSGPNGEVWRGEYEGQQVAIKCTAAAAAARTSHISSSGDLGMAIGDKELKALENFTKEIRMAAFLDHPNIVRFIGLSWRTLPDLCMVSELVALGDLASFLARREARKLTWVNDKLGIAANVANALVYLHSLTPPVVHRDLKSMNVLLTEEMQAKVSDFGLSRETSFDETMTSGVGTLLWTAPEVLRGERYSEKADIYSFGVILSELDTCLPPYSSSQGRKNKNDMDWVPRIASGQATPSFRKDCPKALRELADQCLHYDPTHRPDAMHIVYMLLSKIPQTMSSKAILVDGVH